MFETRVTRPFPPSRPGHRSDFLEAELVWLSQFVSVLPFVRYTGFEHELTLVTRRLTDLPNVTTTRIGPRLSITWRPSRTDMETLRTGESELGHGRADTEAQLAQISQALPLVGQLLSGLSGMADARAIDPLAPGTHAKQVR